MSSRRLSGRIPSYIGIESHFSDTEQYVTDTLRRRIKARRKSISNAFQSSLICVVIYIHSYTCCLRTYRGLRFFVRVLQEVISVRKACGSGVPLDGIFQFLSSVIRLSVAG